MKDDGGSFGSESHKTCKASVKSSPQTNKHTTFYRPDASTVAKTNSVRALKGYLTFFNLPRPAATATTTATA